jgi:hypothetical protein
MLRLTKFCRIMAVMLVYIYIYYIYKSQSVLSEVLIVCLLSLGSRKEEQELSFVCCCVVCYRLPVSAS